MDMGPFFLSHRNVLIHRIRRVVRFRRSYPSSVMSFAFVVNVSGTFVLVSSIVCRSHCSYCFNSFESLGMWSGMLSSRLRVLFCLSLVVSECLPSAGCGWNWKCADCCELFGHMGIYTSFPAFGGLYENTFLWWCCLRRFPWAFPFPYAPFVCLFVSIDCSSFPVSLRPPSCARKWFLMNELFGDLVLVFSWWFNFCDAKFLGRLRSCLRCRFWCCCLPSLLVFPSVHPVVASCCVKWSASGKNV